jgi:RND family efflux transporter MFP subunit
MQQFHGDPARGAETAAPNRVTAPGAGRRRQRVKLGLAALLALAAAGAGWRLLFTGPPATAAAGPPPVTVAAPVVREMTEWEDFTGQFTAVEQVEVRARVSGYLQSINFKDGQMVEKGDLLFVIDPRPFTAALALAEAQLAQADAKLQLANRQLSRARSLKDRDFVSGSVYDERLQEMRVAAADVEGAKARVEAARLDVEFTEVRAAASGRIDGHQVSVGNLVSGGTGAGPATLLTTIVSLDPIRLEIDVSEDSYLRYARAVRAGKVQSPRERVVKVMGRLFDEPGWNRVGQIDFVSNMLDRSAGTIRVRAVFPNPDLLLTPGQFGRVRIPTSEPHEALLVPDSAILSDQSNKIVMTVAGDGTVVPKPVTLGPAEGELRVVRTGLEPTDTVIINGLVRARPGAKVMPQPGAIAAASAE